MKRMFKFLHYEIKENDRGLRKFIGKDMIVFNKNHANLFFIQNAELEELQGIQPGLLITLVQDNKEK